MSQLRKEILDDSPIKYSIIQNGRRPPTVRLITGGEFLDFRLKEIRTSSVKQIWLGKVVDIKSTTNYVVHTRKENNWLCVTGRTIIHRAEEKTSDYHDKSLMYVLDRSYLKDFRRYLEILDNRVEKNKQKPLINYFNSETSDENEVCINVPEESINIPDIVQEKNC